jgi:hypothetical protein
LQPGISYSPWTSDEDAIIRSEFARIGPKWCVIRERLPTRTDIGIKNRWALLLRKSRTLGESPIEEAPKGDESEDCLNPFCVFDFSERISVPERPETDFFDFGFQ